MRAVCYQFVSHVIRLDDPADPRLALYRGVSDAVLLEAHGLFVAEGRLVVRRLLAEAPLTPVSVLVTASALVTLEDVLASRPDLPVYVAPQAVMNEIAGFNIHRGCLALGTRPSVVPAETMLDRLPEVTRVVALDAVSNADNVGGIFRSAAALGASAVLLGAGCSDPLYRKAIRTSMGASLVVPFAALRSWAAFGDALRARRFVIVALTPAGGALMMADAALSLARERRVALLAGAEGEGLGAEALAMADVHVRIPMADGVDSLNVNVAVGIALHSLAPEGRQE